MRKAVNDDVAAMHHLVGYTITDATGALVVPAVSLVYLAMVTWRLTLVTLVPLVAGLASYVRTMASAMEGFAEYDRATGRVMAGAVEFSHGIAVVKAFGQGRRAHRRFLDAADDFATFFLSWVRAAGPRR